MACIRRVFLAVIASLIIATAALNAQAQDPIRCARTPDISPDGRWVAFSYMGDIWIVEAIGGVARALTKHESYHVGPIFSPDGKQIAFTSNRHGSYDVYVMPVEGGRPTRLTSDSASDVANGWSPDGKTILFSSTRSAGFPLSYELFAVPVEGGRAYRVSAAEGREGVFSPKGDQIAYVRGPGTWYRKGYRGSASDDVWICDANGSNNRRLTTFEGQDNSPMWSADGQTVYYVSEVFGSPANIVRQGVTAGSKPEQVTFHKEDGVRRARISRNGEWIVYECGPDLWIASTGGSPPRKLAIEVHADDKTNIERKQTFVSGATEYALSPDEKHVAFVVHGEIFLIPIAGGKATQMTDHPAYDHGVAWAPDGKSILFLSDRNGHEDIYELTPDDPEHPELTKAHKFKVKQLTDTPDAEAGISFSPDGKLVAFLRAGRLWTMKPDGTEQKIVIDKTQVFDYDWSPDGKWFVYARMDGSFASDIHIIPVGGGESKNVTRYATFNGDVSWSSTGHKIGFVSQRRRGSNMFVLSLQKPAITGAPASADFDWEDIHLRAAQAAPIEAQEGSISPDGTKVAFRSSGSSGDDLWVANTNGSQLTRITTGSTRPTQIRWSKRSPDWLYFRDGAGALRMVRVGFGGDAARIPFTAKMTIRREEEFAEMFEQSWRALADQFYDAKFHGADWNAVRQKYRPLLKHIATKEDLYALISLMLGELNASHLGISGFASAPDEITADLGLLYDESYRGNGLKIAEVLKRGPADRRGLNLKPGDIITAIDGVEITPRVDLSKVLNDKVGETLAIHVLNDPMGDPKDPKNRRRIEMQAVSRMGIQDLMYERWVDKNAKRVAEVSNGKLGYIHIPSMDEPGLDRFVRDLYSDNFDKEAIVLDVRFNSGGFTHDQVLNYLGAKEHTYFRQRNGNEGVVLRSYDRKWSKPLVLLINNRSYSDAEIFPNAFRTLGLGKLVGEPTGGYVIGTSGIRLIDGSLFRIPRTGVYTLSGINMEKEGVKPDIMVEQHPDQMARGIDPQLDKAIQVLQTDVAAWKKNQKVAVKAPVSIEPMPLEVLPLPRSGK
jgi:tricorn protease